MDPLLYDLIFHLWWPLEDTNVSDLLFCCPCGKPNVNVAIKNFLYIHRYFMSFRVKYLCWLFALIACLTLGIFVVD